MDADAGEQTTQDSAGLEKIFVRFRSSGEMELLGITVWETELGDLVSNIKNKVLYKSLIVGRLMFSGMTKSVALGRAHLG